MLHDHYPNGQFPAGEHPYLKVNGRPIKYFPSSQGYSPASDPSNFSLDGELGRILRSNSFTKFMNPYYDSDDGGGRTTEAIWHWLTWVLKLRPWKDQTATDLGWLEECLRTLDFLTRRQVDGYTRWFYEGF